jgi:hypothetical protein
VCFLSRGINIVAGTPDEVGASGGEEKREAFGAVYREALTLLQVCTTRRLPQKELRIAWRAVSLEVLTSLQECTTRWLLREEKKGEASSANSRELLMSLQGCTTRRAPQEERRETLCDVFFGEHCSHDKAAVAGRAAPTTISQDSSN